MDTEKGGNRNNAYLVSSYIGMDIDEKTPIYELELSVRAENALSSLGAKTVGDVMRLTKKELFRARGIGKKTMHEIANLFLLNNIPFVGNELYEDRMTLKRIDSAICDLHRLAKTFEKLVNGRKCLIKKIEEQEEEATRYFNQGNLKK